MVAKKNKSMFNRAGAFEPKTGSRKDVLNFGKSRDPEARGKFIDGWTSALSTWVDCRAFLYSFDSNVYDITDDIITGSLVRNTDAPTDMSITFANEGDKYRQLFIPNDRIVLYLRRNEIEWQSFTGYINNTPLFNLYQSKELTLECSCIIKRLNQKFWDPAYRENVLILSGGTPSSTGSNESQGNKEGDKPENNGDKNGEENAPSDAEVKSFFANAGSDDPEKDNKDPNAPDEILTPEEEKKIEGETGASGYNTPDMTLAFLLTAPDHIGIKPEMVYIQKFPQEWTDKAAKITAGNTACMSLWADMIVCPDDTPGDCGDGSGSGGEGSKEGCPDGSTIGSIIDAAGFPESEKERAVQTAFCESGGDAGAQNPAGPGGAGGGPTGLFQIVVTTAQGVDPEATMEKLKDPTYNANIAKQLWEQRGWTPWECAPGVGQYGSGNADTPITNCPEGSKGSDKTEGGSGQGTKEDKGSNVRYFSNVEGDKQGDEEQPVDEKNPKNLEGDKEFKPTEDAPCGTGAGSGSSQEPGQKGSGKAPQGWHLVDTDKMEMRVNNQSQFGEDVKYGMSEWSSRNGVKVIEDSSNPTITIYDGTPNPGAAATTYSAPDRKMVLGPNYAAANQNARSGMIVHEFGHAHGFDHEESQPSVMQPAFSSNTNDNPTSPTEYDDKLYAEVWGTGGGVGNDNSDVGFSNANTARNRIDLFANIVGNAHRTPYRWGGGHGEIEDFRGLKDRGVDAAGLFNSLRKIAGLEYWNVGGVVDYFKFLENIREFDSKTFYPPGTILINPGNRNVMGHMAMIYDEDQHVIEANGRKGLYKDYTVQESNKNWVGYSHVGDMPDVEVRKKPVPERFIKNDPYNKPFNKSSDVLSANAAGGCDDSQWDYSATGATSHNHSSLIQGVVDKVTGKWDTYSNTYVGHPGGEQNSVDFWGPASRGDPIASGMGNEIRDFLIDNYSDKINWIIFEGRMLSSGGWGPDTSGFGHYDHVHVTMGSPDCGGGTVNGEGGDPGGKTGGSDKNGGGSGGGASDVETEPCITRHPLGVYKLAATAFAEIGGDSSHMADMKRILALTGSMESVKAETQRLYPEDEYEKFPELFEPCTEVRDWQHLAELNKESYMATVQDIKDYGMYTMMSIGTGEIVFWYPWIVENIADDVANTKEDRETEEGKLTKTEINELYDKYPSLRAYDISDYSRDELSRLFPELDKKKAKDELEEKKDISGLPLDRTNVSVLTDVMRLRDIDLVDFSLYVSDDPLVTHYYVLGEYRLEQGSGGGMIDLQCQRWSTIFDHPLMVDKAKKSPHWDPNLFIQRYGVRSKSEQVSSIKIPGMAQIWAEQQWLRHWLNCYIIQLSTSFLPELYPGQRLEIESLGTTVVILQVSHTFGSEWSTQMTVSQPIEVADDSVIPPIPFWSLIDTSDLAEAADPDNAIKSIDDSIPVDNAPLGTEGDLWEQIEFKRKEENKRLRAYLDYWADLRDNPGLLDRTEELYEKNPGMIKPTGPVTPIDPDEAVPIEYNPVEGDNN